MVSESLRAAEVIRRLRDFFRAGTTRLEPIPLSGLISSATAAFAARAAQEDVAFTVPPVPDSVVLGDRPQLEIVIRNLLSNAFDAVSSQPPGRRSVRLSAELQGSDRVCIGVEDSGPGISSGAAARLFEPFSSSKASGLGLGLAISRAIAEAHGGALWTELGNHGVFRLALPAERKAARAV
jgi:C4-dicarboxylate-specific signal transduction histidine kinase